MVNKELLDKNFNTQSKETLLEFFIPKTFKSIFIRIGDIFPEIFPIEDEEIKFVWKEPIPPNTETLFSFLENGKNN